MSVYLITIIIIKDNPRARVRLRRYEEGGRREEEDGKSWARGGLEGYEDLRAVLFHASNQLRGLARGRSQRM